MTVNKIVTRQNNTISSLGHSVLNRCQPPATSTTSSTLCGDVIVIRWYSCYTLIYMSTNQYIVRQQTRHTTALNTTTSMTDVLCYHTVIITTTLVVDESPDIYPTVEVCGVPGLFYQNFSCYTTVGRTQLNTACPLVRRPSGVPVRRTYRLIYHRTNRPNDSRVGRIGARQQP